MLVICERWLVSGGGGPGIDAAAPCRAGKAGEWGEAHARVPALAAFDGARAGAGAEVQGDEVDLVAGLAEELGGRARDEGVADAVEAVLAETVALCDFGVNGIGADMVGEGRVELAVEAGDIVGGREVVEAGADDGQAVGVVQRGEVVEVFNVVLGLGRDELGFRKVSAVDDAVADDPDIVLALDLGQVGVVDEGLDDDVKGIALADGLTADLLVLVDRLAVPRVGQLYRRR